METLTITKENFAQEVESAVKPVLIDFWASWCGPCRMLSPIVEKFAASHPDVKVGKVNVDEQAELATRFNIMSIPTLIAFKGGKAVNTSVGVIQEPAIEALLK